MRRHWWVLGLVLLITGVVALLIQGDPRDGDFGWFAYTPLDDGTSGLSFEGGTLLFVTTGRLLAALGAPRAARPRGRPRPPPGPAYDVRPRRRRLTPSRL